MTQTSAVARTPRSFSLSDCDKCGRFRTYHHDKECTWYAQCQLMPGGRLCKLPASHVVSNMGICTQCLAWLDMHGEADEWPDPVKREEWLARRCPESEPPPRPDIPTRLLALWHEANEEMTKAAGQSGFEDAFNYWSGATKDLLIAVGYEWDDAAGDYVLRTTSACSGAPKE